jgi:hypothetical protein
MTIQFCQPVAEELASRTPNIQRPTPNDSLVFLQKIASPELVERAKDAKAIPIVAGVADPGTGLNEAGYI